MAELAAASQPHVDEFARFEVWAHRAQDAVVVGPEETEEALREATFAPIRHERHVLFAVVEHKGRVLRKIAYPSGTELPGKLQFAPVSSPSLARIEASLQRPCQVTVPGWWRDGAGKGACVILSRESEREGGEALRVTVGYVISAVAGDGVSQSAAQSRAD